MGTPTALSPNVDNYFIGKGIVSIADPDTSPFNWRDVGNVPTFEFTPNITFLDHYSSRFGTKIKDLVAVTELAASVRVVLEEMTPANLAMVFMSTLESGATGGQIMDRSDFRVAVKFVGQNVIGARVKIILNKVQFRPTKAFAPISDGWGNFELEGQCLLIAGESFQSFGTWEWFDTPISPNE